MLSAFMAFIEPGDEVIIFEPFFDQYVRHNSFQEIL
jgi:kynurenine aminotransferase